MIKILRLLFKTFYLTNNSKTFSHSKTHSQKVLFLMYKNKLKITLYIDFNVFIVTYLLLFWKIKHKLKSKKKKQRCLFKLDIS